MEKNKRKGFTLAEGATHVDTFNKKRKFGFTLAEGATHVDNSNNKRRFAFTLAEVLITLGIIGVVAALTIPTLVQNYQTKSWATASQVFEAKFTEALKTMNVQGQLGKYGKYNDTEGFVEELQKHYKITKVCDKDHTMQCFEKTTTVNDKEVDMSAIVDASGFGQDDWGTNVMGIQFANGVTGLIAYNPKCTADPYDNKITGSDCFALVYDTSGFSDPNEMGKDFNQFGSVKRIGPADCIAEVGGVCVTTQAFTPTSITKAECEALKGELGISECQYDDDYWAGAVKQCGGVSKLPNETQLAAIMDHIYSGQDGSRNDDNALSLGIDLSMLGIWSGVEMVASNSYYRSIDHPLFSEWATSRRDCDDGMIQAICVK